ncbi:MAG TPA: DeoR/GlpR family DNA-binding transcription regulator [Kouleothrix sp.]|nr:DeoR/GlpR family DNA-binding transcription regulator [Kouleothrix sp.]
MTLSLERHAQIAQLIETQGRATVEELSARFGVSEATIRRDLEKLDAQGAVRRAHGGAVAVLRATPEPPVLRRADEHAAEKRQIGAAAAQLVADGDTIILGSGTTTPAVARHLGGKRNLKVITNALNIALLLANQPEITLIVTGGLVRSSEQSMIGHLTERALSELRADKLIMGIRALSLAEGLSNEYGLETSVDRAMLRCAPQIIVVADHSKFERVASVVLAPINTIHTLVTSSLAPMAALDELRRLGVQVVVAPTK